MDEEPDVTNARMAERKQIPAAMFQHLVENLPKRVEAVMAAKGGNEWAKQYAMDIWKRVPLGLHVSDISLESPWTNHSIFTLLLEQIFILLHWLFEKSAPTLKGETNKYTLD